MFYLNKAILFYLFFFETKEGYIHGMCSVYSVPTKIPLLPKKQGHIQEKKRTMNQRPWMKQWCLWGEWKVSLFHTPSTGLHQFLPLFQQKRENGDVRKRDQHQEQEKVKKEKKEES